MLYIIFPVLILHTLRWVFRQWGKIEGIPKGSWTAYPIYMANTYAIVMTDINIANDPLVLSAVAGQNNDGFNSFGRRVVDDDGKIYGTWVAIGR